MTWTHWNCHLKPSPMDFCLSCGHFEWSHDQFTTILSFGPKLAKSNQKWPKKAPNDRKWPWMSEKWHLKPSPLDFCFSCGHWESAVILSGHMTSLRQFWVLGQNWLKVTKNGQKRPQMTEIRLNVWIMTSETIFIGFLLLLRSFWVVTWLVCDSFEFGAKISKNGQNWPKKAPNDRN